MWANLHTEATCMNRVPRLGLAVIALVLVLAGSALAIQAPHDKAQVNPLAGSHEPESSEAPEAPPTADVLARAVERLAASGITTTNTELATLAKDYGLGGAIRLLAWSKAAGKSLADLRAMRDAGKGWGVLAHELGVSPGIGSIMGGGGGAKDKGAKDASEKAEPSESETP